MSGRRNSTSMCVPHLLLVGLLFFLSPQLLLAEAIPGPPKNLRLKGTPIPEDGKPMITSVSGTLAHGNEIVIRGTNFGLHADYGGPGSPYLSVAFQNFDNGAVAGGNVAQHETSRWGSPLRWVCGATQTGARRPGGHVAYSIAYVESGSALSNGQLSVTPNTNPTIHNTGVSYLSYWIKMDASNINNVARGTIDPISRRAFTPIHHEVVDIGVVDGMGKSPNGILFLIDKFFSRCPVLAVCRAGDIAKPITIPGGVITAP